MLTEKVTAPAHRTEAFTWLSTGQAMGNAAGAALAGILASTAGAAGVLAILPAFGHTGKLHHELFQNRDRQAVGVLRRFGLAEVVEHHAAVEMAIGQPMPIGCHIGALFDQLLTQPKGLLASCQGILLLTHGAVQHGEVSVAGGELMAVGGVLGKLGGQVFAQRLGRL